MPQKTQKKKLHGNGKEGRVRGNTGTEEIGGRIQLMADSVKRVMANGVGDAVGWGAYVARSGAGLRFIVRWLLRCTLSTLLYV